MDAFISNFLSHRPAMPDQPEAKNGSQSDRSNNTVHLHTLQVKDEPVSKWHLHMQ